MKPRYAIRIAGIFLMLFLGTGKVRPEGKFGIGFVFGEPTGFAWKYRMNHTNAFAGAIGFFPDDRFRFNVDYLWHSHPFEEQSLALHYGIGGAFGFGRTDYVAVRGNDGYFLRREDLGFGARVILGLTYDIPRSPVDVFLEVAPVFVLSPNTGIGADIGIGARIYP